MGSPSSQPMAFAGPDGGSSTNPAVAAMSAALQGKPNPQVAQNDEQLAASKSAGPGQPNLPMPNGSGIYVDPHLVQRRPQLSHAQILDIMSNPSLDIVTKQGYQQQYQQQNQPIEVPYPGGHVIIDPLNPTRQQFIPDLAEG
jgi:hypothetical protein